MDASTGGRISAAFCALIYALIRAMKILIATLALAMSLFAFPSSADANTCKIAGRIKGNVDVKLMDGHISSRRGQNLEISVKPLHTVDGAIRQIIFPSHSFSPAERTLMILVRYALGRTIAHAQPSGKLLKPGRAQKHLVLSIPKTAKGYVTNFECWFVSELGK